MLDSSAHVSRARVLVSLPRLAVSACYRYRFASPAEARERAKATLLDPGNGKEHVRLTYMMECICVLRMCRQVGEGGFASGLTALDSS